MEITGRSQAHVLTKGRCFACVFLFSNYKATKTVTVPPVQPVNSFFASLPDEDSDYLSEDEMENTAYILNSVLA